MTAFAFKTLVPQEPPLSAALGTGSGNAFGTNDINKAVKLAANNNYVSCAAGDDIEGFVSSVEPYTVNAGFSFGSVQVEGRHEAVIGSGANVAIGGYVVADTPLALGTAGNTPVKTGTPTRFFWRVINNITSPGNAAAVGHVVLLERVC